MPRLMTILDRCSERCDKQIDKPQHITDRNLHITPSQFMPTKMFINDADTPGFQERQADFVMLIHFAKCKRGDQCPIPSCRGTSASTKRMLIDAFQTSVLGEHYAKCRAQATNIITQGACNCGILRFGLQELQERFFPHRQLSLEMLAACALPYSPSLIFHPMGETTIALRSAAIKVQRQWRTFLYAREKRPQNIRDLKEIMTTLAMMGLFD